MGIVFVTARSLRADRLSGLTVGADAYLVKPVDMDELVLILKRLAQRFAAPPNAAQHKPVGAVGKQWQFEPVGGFVVAPNDVRVLQPGFLTTIQASRAECERPWHFHRAFPLGSSWRQMRCA